jgi:ABC-2 type transport system permease protein
MNTRKVKEIVKFDVERNIQNKWFVLLNVVMLIGILIGTNWSNISKFMKENNINFLGTDEVKIEILDEENLFYDDFVENCKEYDNFKIEKVTENKYSKDNVPESNVIFIEVERNEREIIKAKIISKEGIDTDIYDFIYENLKETRSKVFAENNGITIEELNVLNNEIVVDRQMLGVDAENSSTKELIKVICVLIVYMSLIFVLSRIANEIAQEKVSKSIEYVLTSVSEKEYLLAKVLSSTLTILIQLLYTFVYYIIGNMISSLVSVNTAGENFEVTSLISNVDSSIVSYVLAMCAYLIFTVFLTTLIQAALSSKTTSVSEAGNTTMLLISIIVILYIVSISAINTYTTVSPLMYAISCLPIVSTFFVPAMMIIGQATTVQIIISFIVLIASVPLIFNVCAKHFKNGILDYTSNKKKRFFGKKAKRQMDLKERQDYELRLSKTKKYAFTIGISMILFVFLESVISFICSLILPSLLGNSIDEGSLMILINSITLIFALLITTGCIKIYSDYDNGEKKNLTSLQKFEIIFGGIALLAIVQIFLNWLYPKIGLDYSIFEQAQIAPGNTVFGKILYVARNGISSCNI